MEKSPLASTVERVQSFVKSSMTAEDLYQAYDDWAHGGSYDEDMAAVNSRGPVIAAEVFESLYPIDSRDISIMDVAAGSGRAGEQLYKKGFKCIDAVDPAKAMLEQAKLKGVYRNFICSPVGYDPIDIAKGSYDAVVCVGGLAEGHLPAESLTEMIRLVKTDGHVVMISNYSTWESSPEYGVKMANIMEELVTKGKIVVVRKDIVESYRMCSERETAKGIVIVLKNIN